MRNLTKVSVCLVVAVGCGGGRGGSGIDEGKVISTMTDAEIMALCNDARAVFPPRMVTCEGESGTVGISPEECTSGTFIDKAGCEATAGEVLDCAAAFDAETEAEFCSSQGQPPSGCSAEVIACIDGGA